MEPGQCRRLEMQQSGQKWCTGYLQAEQVLGLAQALLLQLQPVNVEPLCTAEQLKFASVSVLALGACRNVEQLCNFLSLGL